MTDARAVITEALMEHNIDDYVDENDDGTISTGMHCLKCRLKFFTMREVYNHIADVLLSLDGIAIVTLPKQMTDRSNVAEPIRDRPMWQVGDAWTCILRTGEIELEADGQAINGAITSAMEARALAAALLAAAAAAEKADSNG